MYRVNQAEYVTHIFVFAPLEYVNIYSTDLHQNREARRELLKMGSERSCAEVDVSLNGHGGDKICVQNGRFFLHVLTQIYIHLSLFLYHILICIYIHIYTYIKVDVCLDRTWW